MNEEKKVDAVREFYNSVVGNVNGVQTLQFISERSQLSFYAISKPTNLIFLLMNIIHICGMVSRCSSIAERVSEMCPDESGSKF